MNDSISAVRFNVEGLINSYKVPFFRTYHKTFLAPPKTVIVGMLVNIMNKSEKYYYELLQSEKLKVSVVINDIEGKVKDLWAYKSLENKSGMFGRSIVRRDKLFKANYTIYVTSNEKDLLIDICDSLKNPKTFPSLGLDDEIVKIEDVSLVEMKQSEENTINSIFMDKGYKYEVNIKDYSKQVELPMANVAPLKYEVELNEDSRGVRKAADKVPQIEYMNCFVKIDDAVIFTDRVNQVVFY